MRDRLFEKPLQDVPDFAFGEDVARVFRDMISRSVPGYADVLAGMARVARRFAKPETRLYDLGCSLGAATLAMRRAVSLESCSIVAVDASPAMVDRCRHNVAADNSRVPVFVEQADIRDVSIDRASVVALNFTLQFVPPSDREGILARIHEGLVAGGVLILSEKISTKTMEGELLDALHLQFKRDCGYSDLEISQKRSALERVMILDTLDEHRARLTRVGFSSVVLWYQHYNFCSILAVKADDCEAR